MAKPILEIRHSENDTLIFTFSKGISPEVNRTEEQTLKIVHMTVEGEIIQSWFGDRYIYSWVCYKVSGAGLKALEEDMRSVGWTAKLKYNRDNFLPENIPGIISFEKVDYRPYAQQGLENTHLDLTLSFRPLQPNK